jgi:hypothetical protein
MYATFGVIHSFLKVKKMIIEIKGSVKVIFAEEQINDNFSKKDIVVTIEEDTQYAQDIIIQAANSKIDLLKEVQPGNKVIAKCNLRGYMSKDGKYFTQLTLWAIENKTNQ